MIRTHSGQRVPGLTFILALITAAVFRMCSRIPPHALGQRYRPRLAPTSCPMAELVGTARFPGPHRFLRKSIVGSAFCGFEPVWGGVLLIPSSSLFGFYFWFFVTLARGCSFARTSGCTPAAAALAAIAFTLSGRPRACVRGTCRVARLPSASHGFCGQSNASVSEGSGVLFCLDSCSR